MRQRRERRKTALPGANCRHQLRSERSEEPDARSQRLGVRLTREQIERGPDASEDRPVSRQFEEEYYRYYGWPTYWGGAGLWSAYPYPQPLFVPTPTAAGGAADQRGSVATQGRGEGGDEHLRSAKDVTGHRIRARDGAIGHVEDFVVDDRDWAIRYLVVDTRNWLPGRKVLVTPQWVTGVSWERGEVAIDLDHETIRRGPEFDPCPGRLLHPA